MFGNIEPPVLVLEKKSGEVIGVLGDYIGLKGELKYNQKSNFTFDYPAYIDKVKTPFYDDLIGDRLIRLDPYGVFLLDGPESKGSGDDEKKACTCYSLEYELDDKSISVEAGTYRLYDLSDPTSSSTVVGRILEKAKNWSIGSVSKTLWSKYRTFDDTDTKIYSWMIDTLQDTFNCIFEFDTYTRTINIVDADADVEILPVYISHDNMIKEGTITEVRDKMYTKLSVYGADPLTIRDVNPIGSNYIYNLDYYIGLGDIPSDVATKWASWQALTESRQQYYTSLVNLRTAAYNRYLAANSSLTDLNSELASLDNLRSTNTQGLASATTDTAITYYTGRLSEIATQYSAKEAEIAAQQTLVDTYYAEYVAAGEDVSAVVSELSISNYFTTDELKTLDYYFKEDTFTDSTFAVYDVDVSGDSDSLTNIATASVALSGTTLADVEMTGIWGCNDCYRHFSYAGTPTVCPYCGSSSVYSVEASGRRLFSISGGSITISGTYTKLADDGTTETGTYALFAEILNGTIDHKTDGETVCSFYLSAGTVNGSSFASGNLTIASTSAFDNATFLGNMEAVVETTTDEDTGTSYSETHYEGGSSFDITGGSVYFTRNVTDSQQYYVAKELYDYAVGQLEDISMPTYSFELSTINPIFAQEFEPFKNALKLGAACYLQLRDDLLTKQMLIEIDLDYDNPESFDMVFSNEFQRPDYTNTRKKLLDEATSSAATLDFKRFNYGDTSGLYNAVYDFINNGLDAVSTQVLAGATQNVTIDKRGIKIATVGGKEYILMADGMIAIIDENGNSKMAMGHFYNTASGQNYYGVLADVIGGTLLIGLELNITCPDANGGIAQFKVDSSGCFLNNSRFYLQSDSGGRIGLDANYGFFAGTSSLFTTTDTGYVTPSFISDGEIQFDDDGMPLNTNFMVDISTGNVYLRGKIVAESGYFRGVVQASDFQDQSGNSMLTSDGKWDSSYLDLGNITLDGDTGNIDMTGDITLGGNINITGSINWTSSNSPVTVQYSVDGSTNWHSTYASTDYFARYSYDGGVTWTDAVRIQGKNGTNGSDASVPTYIHSTYIDSTTIKSPTIEANVFNVYPPNSTSTGGGFYLYGNYNGTQYLYAKMSIGANNGTPMAQFTSESGIPAYWSFPNTYFSGGLDFASCSSIYWGGNAPTAVFA